MEEYIHMGQGRFNKDKFEPIKNRAGWVKPYGGLWSSPENAPYGWEDWAISNDFETNLNDWFLFTLNNDARVLKIISAEQLKDLPKLEVDLPHNWVTLDFEKLAEEYDAMLVMISSDQQLYWDLYGWDCDTLLVFNPDVINFVRGTDV